MANLEVIALDTVTPQLKAPQAGDGYAMPRPVTVSGTQSTNASAFSVSGTNTNSGTTINGISNSTLLTGTTAATSFYGINNALTINPPVGTTISIAVGAVNAINLSSTSTPTQFFGTRSTWQLNTSATGGTISNAASYNAQAPAISASATTNITNAYGYNADTITQGALQTISNAYSFYGNQVTGTNRWNLYMAGSAPNYMAGQLAVGNTNLTNAINYIYGGNTTLSTNNWLDGQNGTNTATIYLNRFTGNLVGGATTTTMYGNYFSSNYFPAAGAAIASMFNVFSAGVLASTITPTNIYSVYAYNQYSGAALGGTVTNYGAFYAASPLFGAAATTNTTNAYQFFASDIVNGAACTITNGYGFYGNVATGTNRWNLYMAGTAPNYLNGGLYLGGTTATSAILTGKAAATLQHGAADAAAPVAQTIGVQSVVAGTSNTAGAAFTIRGSQGTGTGVGGNIIFQVAPAGTAGTAQNALATAMTVYNDKTVAVGAAFTVATLPAAGTQGRRAWVTDALAPTFLGALTGGGAVVTPVFDNGTAWVSG